MAIKIDPSLTPLKLLPKLHRFFDVSAEKILRLEKAWDLSKGAPVFTVDGRYTARSWTEWTQGFQFGSALLQFDATGDARFLEIGRRHTLERMAPHLSHIGVHDHGFNNLSTYGNLLRLMREQAMAQNDAEQQLYELALKVSGAVQAARWTQLSDKGGYIYSFNGPHSLFIDTMRSLRSLAVAHQLGHVLMGERDAKISLLQRLLQHATITARHAIYYGTERDLYDVRGRTAQESIFNVKDGSYRCPSSQQGYSPFTTWTRGLAWGLLGFAELLEFLQLFVSPERLQREGGAQAAEIQESFLNAALAAADYYLEQTWADGIPMWDTGAPNLHRLGDWPQRPSDPYNAWEPVDSSAAAVTAQGLIRLGNYLINLPQAPRAAARFRKITPSGTKRYPATSAARLGRRYRAAGLTVANTLLSEPYLATGPRHQGLILHSVYHRPNGWDYIAPGQRIPNGESSIWGDYHARELALLLLREANGAPYLAFFKCLCPAPAPPELEIRK